jgi:Asp-tRNA(Asn)/Glu-tRNA(Gln) amidotransferase A subunit family amidase
MDKHVWNNCNPHSDFRLLMLDDPETYHGGPVAVQIVGRRLREEQVLEMAETVSLALHQ